MRCVPVGEERIDGGAGGCGTQSYICEDSIHNTATLHLLRQLWSPSGMLKKTVFVTKTL